MKKEEKFDEDDVKGVNDDVDDKSKNNLCNG